MKEQITSNRFLFLAGLILAAAATRLIPHYPNFTAIGAMGLFAGAKFDNKKLAFALPLVAMFLSDLVLGFHINIIAVYVAFALIVSIGFLLKKNSSVTTIALASVSSSILFFVVTNFSMWATGTLYPKSIAGLTECFLAAIPFFHYTAAGDLFFTTVLFGAYQLAKLKIPQLEKVK